MPQPETVKTQQLIHTFCSLLGYSYAGEMKPLSSHNSLSKFNQGDLEAIVVDQGFIKISEGNEELKAARRYAKYLLIRVVSEDEKGKFTRAYIELLNEWQSKHNLQEVDLIKVDGLEIDWVKVVQKYSNYFKTKPQPGEKRATVENSALVLFFNQLTASEVEELTNLILKKGTSSLHAIYESIEVQDSVEPFKKLVASCLDQCNKIIRNRDISAIKKKPAVDFIVQAYFLLIAADAKFVVYAKASQNLVNLCKTLNRFDQKNLRPSDNAENSISSLTTEQMLDILTIISSPSENYLEGWYAIKNNIFFMQKVLPLIFKDSQSLFFDKAKENEQFALMILYFYSDQAPWLLSKKQYADLIDQHSSDQFKAKMAEHATYMPELSRRLKEVTAITSSSRSLASSAAGGLGRGVSRFDGMSSRRRDDEGSPGHSGHSGKSSTTRSVVADIETSELMQRMGEETKLVAFNQFVDSLQSASSDRKKQAHLMGFSVEDLHTVLSKLDEEKKTHRALAQYCIARKNAESESILSDGTMSLLSLDDGIDFSLIAKLIPPSMQIDWIEVVKKWPIKESNEKLLNSLPVSQLREATVKVNQSLCEPYDESFLSTMSLKQIRQVIFYLEGFDVSELKLLDHLSGYAKQLLISKAVMREDVAQISQDVCDYFCDYEGTYVVGAPQLDVFYFDLNALLESKWPKDKFHRLPIDLFLKRLTTILGTIVSKENREDAVGLLNQVTNQAILQPASLISKHAVSKDPEFMKKLNLLRLMLWGIYFCSEGREFEGYSLQYLKQIDFNEPSVYKIMANRFFSPLFDKNKLLAFLNRDVRGKENYYEPLFVFIINRLKVFGGLNSLGEKHLFNLFHYLLKTQRFDQYREMINQHKNDVAGAALALLQSETLGDEYKDVVYELLFERLYPAGLFDETTLSDEQIEFLKERLSALSTEEVLKHSYNASLICFLISKLNYLSDLDGLDVSQVLFIAEFLLNTTKYGSLKEAIEENRPSLTTRLVQLVEDESTSVEDKELVFRFFFEKFDLVDHLSVDELSDDQFRTILTRMGAYPQYAIQAVVDRYPRFARALIVRKELSRRVLTLAQQGALLGVESIRKAPSSDPLFGQIELFREEYRRELSSKNEAAKQEEIAQIKERIAIIVKPFEDHNSAVGRIRMEIGSLNSTIENKVLGYKKLRGTNVKYLSALEDLERKARITIGNFHKVDSAYIDAAEEKAAASIPEGFVKYVDEPQSEMDRSDPAAWEGIEEQLVQLKREQSEAMINSITGHKKIGSQREALSEELDTEKDKLTKLVDANYQLLTDETNDKSAMSLAQKAADECSDAQNSIDKRFQKIVLSQKTEDWLVKQQYHSISEAKGELKQLHGNRAVIIYRKEKTSALKKIQELVSIYKFLGKGIEKKSKRSDFFLRNFISMPPKRIRRSIYKHRPQWFDSYKKQLLLEAFNKRSQQFSADNLDYFKTLLEIPEDKISMETVSPLSVLSRIYRIHNDIYHETLKKAEINFNVTMGITTETPKRRKKGKTAPDSREETKGFSFKQALDEMLSVEIQLEKDVVFQLLSLFDLSKIGDLKKISVVDFSKDKSGKISCVNEDALADYQSKIDASIVALEALRKKKVLLSAKWSDIEVSKDAFRQAMKRASSPQKVPQHKPVGILVNP